MTIAPKQTHDDLELDEEVGLVSKGEISCGSLEEEPAMTISASASPPVVEENTPSNNAELNPASSDLIEDDATGNPSANENQ
jgi:hypothetical protein